MKIKNVAILAVLSALLICGYATMITQRQNYINAHPELNQRTKDAILNGKIFIGMTKEQVIANWGNPQDINRTVGSWGVFEQWVYGYDFRYFSNEYLYFENGKLTSWSD